MPKLKIAFFEVEDWEKEHIKRELKGLDIEFFGEHLDSSNVGKAKDADAVAVFIYSQITPEILAKLPRLKLIVTMSTGYDHIAIAECAKKGITVCNVPNYGENTVAEHTFALILALSRKIIESTERTRKGDFSLEGLRGFDLKGKTIGIIGMGSIGQHVARIAKGFEMKSMAFDVRKDKTLSKKFGFSYASIDSILGNSDIITLHCPYNKATHHLINSGNIKKIKKGAILINTARGGLIETQGLINALSTGIISAAGLDVLEEECAIKEEKQLLSKRFAQECDLRTMLQDHMLQRMDNVIITPHNAFNSREALLRIIDTTMENIEAFGGKKPINVIRG